MIGRRRVMLAMAAALSGCAVHVGERPAPPPPAAPPPAVPETPPPGGARYLYGSAEALAASRQAYAALLDHVRQQIARGAAMRSVVLAPGATLAEPRFVPCDGKPAAVVFDMDETAVLNLGYEYLAERAGGGFDQARWERWEHAGGTGVVAVPGAAAAFATLRAEGVAVIVNTNRLAASAADSAAALAAAGLGRFVHQDTLWLRGDVDGKGGKDARRAAIAGRFCVIAMAGDQAGDFTDLFAGLDPVARRAAADGPGISALWGHGWFVLPNPIYGSAIQGGWDQVFPIERRWTDPGAVRRP